tara:strand:+ start:275 stop:946 length:672 start_codon:yes stop_codon:yes gene_type:complete
MIMNKKAKFVCLLTLIAGWAVALAFAEDAMDSNEVYHKANRLMFNARLDGTAGSGQGQYATELVELSLSTTKQVLSLPMGQYVDSTLNYLIRDLVDSVSEFYQKSAFFTTENTQRMRALYDLVDSLKIQMNAFLYSEFEGLIEADIEAIRESSKETVCSGGYSHNSNGERYCYAYVDKYSDDMHEKVRIFKDAKRQEFIEERFGAQMEEIVALIDEILEGKQA